jgi:hypothetical protein
LLLRIAQEKNINFHICSFEYAEENWHKINSYNHALLIDIGYEGQENATTYGIDFLLKFTENLSLYSLVSFLTVKPEFVIEWIVQNVKWLENMPFPISKSRKIRREEHANLPEPEIRAFVEFFITNRPGRASIWSLSEWQEIRREARKECDRIGQKFGLSNETADWVHHLPFGGRYGNNPQRYEASMDQIKKTLNKIVSIKSLPEYSWQLEDYDGLSSSWDRPPIRALVQFDSDGRDLTTVFYLAAEDVERREEIELNLYVASGFGLIHNYLWFNASALTKGLKILSLGFADEIKTDQFSREQEGQNEMPKVRPKGYIFWKINEYTSSEKLGLSIQIHQFTVRWNGSIDKNQSCLTTEIFPFPDPDSATGKVEEAYNFLKKSGGVLKRLNDGSLEVFIFAKEVLRDDENQPGNNETPDERSKYVYWEVN